MLCVAEPAASLVPRPLCGQHATDEASYLISQADRDGDGRVSECCAVGGGGGDSVCVLYGACVHMNVYCVGTCIRWQGE